jgi:hypothetical protein
MLTLGRSPKRRSTTNLQPHAVVADGDELVEGLDALLVGSGRELLALALLLRGRTRLGVGVRALA